MTDRRHRPSSGPVGTLDWPLYGVNNFLTSRDLTTEQRSRRKQLTRHNRYLHGTGVFYGLWVVPANDQSKPWAIQVCPGYAIDCCGEEIEVLTISTIDVRNHLWRRPPSTQGPAFVGIRYKDYPTKPVEVVSRSCKCEETVYEYSRIRDTFGIDIFWRPPGIPQTTQFNPCTHQLPHCPQCSNWPYVILARINLPSSESDKITQDHINSGVNRRLNDSRN